MNFFPYGSSKEEVYEYLGNVKDLEYFVFILAPFILAYILAHGVHVWVFDDEKKKGNDTTLSPLIVKFHKICGRLMSFIHILFILNGLSHFFHIGWLVDILWYPMWITLYVIKVFSEMYIIIISLFSISRYFIHYSMAHQTAEIEQSGIKSGMSLISGWMFLKDFVLFISLILAFEMRWNKGILIDYYYGIHLIFQLFLFISAFLQFPILCSSRKSEIEPSNEEKLIYHQTIGIAFLKLTMIPVLLYLGFNGVNSEVLSLCFMFADLLVVPIVVQVTEVLWKRAAVQPIMDTKIIPF